MATTPGGTSYTQHAFTNSLGEQSLYAVADAHAGAADLRAITYFHGAGGGYNQFMTLTAWADLRNWLLDTGWVIVEGLTGGANSWGNQRAQDSAAASLAYVDGVLDIAYVVPLGRSMGGIAATRTYLDERGSDARFVGLIVNSGVQDLVWAYEADRWTEAMNTAWGVSTAPAFETVIAGLNPIDGPANMWDGANVLQLYGTADTTVRPTNNAVAMRTMYSGHPAIDSFVVGEGRDHSSTNGMYAFADEMIAFLQEVTGGDPTPPADPRLQRVLSIRDRIGGELYEVRLTEPS